MGFSYAVGNLKLKVSSKSSSYDVLGNISGHISSGAVYLSRIFA
jgi:hypothetical protein